ncbi:MAG: TRAP transporter small permease subunit [Candidatus Accumulibacter sp.]|jgi:TRAP-type C4-dicarboxylate transport system permease small subunit|nr:TRAP transporter small permease subunit [Accumulibacter sp.]
MLAKLDATVRHILRWLAIALFAALGVLLLANVFIRLMGDLTQFLHEMGADGIADAVRAVMPMTSFHWLDEIVELCFSALIFYGAAALWAEKGHFSVGDWISGRLPGHVSRNIYKTLIAAINLAFLIVFFGFSLRLTVQATELSTVFQIPKKLMYSSMTISSMIMALYSLAELVACLGGLRKKPTG